MTNIDSILKSKQRQYFADKDPFSQSYNFSCSHVWMWELDYKESWAPKNWCFWTVVLEKILESPLDNKEIQPVHPKGNQSWMFIGRTGAKAETPVLWPPDVKRWLIGKDPNAGKDWRQEEKGLTEDEVVGWHNWLSGHNFGQALDVGDREAWLVAVHGVTESDMTERLNWTELNWNKEKSLQNFLVFQSWDEEGYIQNQNHMTTERTLNKFSSTNHFVIVVQSLCAVWLFAPPRNAACQASLSITISQSLLRFILIGSVMPSNHLILCCPHLLSPSIFPSMTVFPNESALHIQWPRTGASASASVPPMNIEGWFSSGLTSLISLQPKGL